MDVKRIVYDDDLCILLAGVNQWLNLENTFMYFRVSLKAGNSLTCNATVCFSNVYTVMMIWLVNRNTVSFMPFASYSSLLLGKILLNGVKKNHRIILD
jgi:hypothetical protein